MVEKPDTRKNHGHAVFVRGLDHGFISVGTARLQDVLYTAHCGPVNAITEGKESIGTESDEIQFRDPLPLLVCGQLSGGVNEDIFPICFFIGCHISRRNWSMALSRSGRLMDGLNGSSKTDGCWRRNHKSAFCAARRTQ